MSFDHGEVTSHEGQLNLLTQYFKKNEWHCETEYTLENRRIDFIAWYRYADIIFVGEVKTDLISEIINAVGQLKTAEALLSYHYPNYEIHLGIAAPYPEYDKSGTIATICTNSNIWLIRNSHGKIFFTLNQIKNTSFEVYMLYRLWKIINQKLPEKLEKLKSKLTEEQLEHYDSLIQKEEALKH